MWLCYQAPPPDKATRLLKQWRAASRADPLLLLPLQLTLRVQLQKHTVETQAADPGGTGSSPEAPRPEKLTVKKRPSGKPLTAPGWLLKIPRSFRQRYRPVLVQLRRKLLLWVLCQALRASRRKLSAQ